MWKCPLFDFEPFSRTQISWPACKFSILPIEIMRRLPSVVTWSSRLRLRMLSTIPSATLRRDAAKTALRLAKTVCFDVDSTVITVEAIDEFAAFAGKKEAVAALTARAMGGSLPFQVALSERLALIAPTVDLLNRFLLEHPFKFTPGLEKLVSLLKSRGTQVYLVSGGFTQMIFPVADTLGIPRDQVFANTILFSR